LKISWVILTLNRAQTVAQSYVHNLEQAGAPIDELIWVDNGSSHSEYLQLERLFKCADVKVRNIQNLGVAKGYNRGIVLATGDLIAITGCDRFMPMHWLKTMVNYFETIPQTGVISVYSKPPETMPERFKHRVPIEEDYNGLPIIQAMPMGAKMFRRELLKDVGHLREDFGLYGWEDVEWGYRAQRILAEKNLLSYIIPNFLAVHSGSEGIKDFNGLDNEDYHAFKQREANDPKKAERMEWCRDNGFQHYSPFY
jgi:GT2 family glycosyltransferase